MKILQLAPYFHPYKGGQEKYIYNLSKHLVKIGHEVHVVTADFPKSQECEVLDGIIIERHNCLIRPLRNPITPDFLKMENQLKKYDIVHTHNEHSFAAMVAAYFRTRINVPLVLTCHGRLEFGTVLNDELVKIYDFYIGRKIFEIADVICANSIMDRDYLSSFDPNLYKKIKLLSNAIDPDVLRNLEGICLQSEALFQHDSKIILFVGRLIKRKGIEWLIKAMDIIVNREKRNDALAILIGTGEDKSHFENLVMKYNLESHIALLGELSDQELIYFYKKSHIFVLPSLSEVCPTVILEAMYFGLPVVATKIPGIEDHFSSSALLIPPKDEIALAKALIHLLDNDILSEKMGFQGMKLVNERYTWDKISMLYDDIYKNLAK
jgi:glycosyltransferase involved in cell wall biosynthesis